MPLTAPSPDDRAACCHYTTGPLFSGGRVGYKKGDKTAPSGETTWQAGPRSVGRWNGRVPALRRRLSRSRIEHTRGAPARRALATAGYTRLVQLTSVGEAELLQLHGVGPKAIRLLREALAAQGLAFAERNR